MHANKDIRGFFKSKPVSEPARVATKLQQKTAVIKSPLIPTTPSDSSSSMSKMGQSTSAAPRTPERESSPFYASSLSSVPSSAVKSPEAEFKKNRPRTPGARDRVIKGSDEEDSDSELESLEAIFGRSAAYNQPQSIMPLPTTPTHVRTQKYTGADFHKSPLAVLPKHQFDMRALISHAKEDDATEISSKRVKAMQSSSDGPEHTYTQSNPKVTGIDHFALIESIAGVDEGGTSKVSRAIRRTEATVTEKRWYFFDTRSGQSKAERTPFPKAAVPKSWENELRDTELRRQSFVSGFVGDMVELGKALPDELFLWILNEACLESNDPLRTSYFDTLQGMLEQLERLLVPKLVQSLFERIGATPLAANISGKVTPGSAPTKPYQKRDWTRLRSLVRFLGHVGEPIQQQSRTCIMIILLRMSIDRTVIENVDLLALVQKTFNRVCLCTPERSWESCCKEVCKTLFESVELPRFRLNMLETILCTTSRTRDLRQRLAMCFFFNDLSYSLRHPSKTRNINKFFARLHDKDFDTTPQTDFPQLTALVLLLDIAIDNGRSSKLDLSDSETETEFNQDVDRFVIAIKDIMSGIGNPGAAFISRIETKEALELVGQRIADTVRTKVKVKKSWYDLENEKKPPENLEKEKQGMSRFLMKMKKKEVTSQATTA